MDFTSWHLTSIRPSVFNDIQPSLRPSDNRYYRYARRFTNRNFSLFFTSPFPFAFLFRFVVVYFSFVSLPHPPSPLPPYLKHASTYIPLSIPSCFMVFFRDPDPPGVQCFDGVVSSAAPPFLRVFRSLKIQEKWKISAWVAVSADPQ